MKSRAAFSVNMASAYAWVSAGRSGAYPSNLFNSPSIRTIGAEPTLRWMSDAPWSTAFFNRALTFLSISLVTSPSSDSVYRLQSAPG